MKISQNDLRFIDSLIDEGHTFSWKQWLSKNKIGWVYRTDPHHGGKIVEHGRFVKDFYYEDDSNSYYFERMVE